MYVLKNKILGRSIQVHGDKDLLLPHRVMIGFSTPSTMRKNDLLPTEEVHCEIACRTFLTEAYKYAVVHLPLRDAVLQHAEFLDIKTYANASFTMSFSLRTNSQHLKKN